MRLHVEALFTRDASGCLLAVNEPGGGPAPWFFLGRTVEGVLVWLRRDVSDAFATDLRALCGAEPRGFDVEPNSIKDAPFITRVSLEAPVTKIWTGPAFEVPTDLPDSGSAVRVTADNADVLNPYLEAWHADVDAATPMVVVLVGRSAVSVCASVRVTAQAHEAGVETHPAFRGRGYGPKAVAAWAKAVRERGCIPLYSTSWSNGSARGLARKLGLVQFGSDLHVT
jgi:GNAT superfamily N-acetyltransferase